MLSVAHSISNETPHNSVELNPKYSLEILEADWFRLRRPYQSSDFDLSADFSLSLWIKCVGSVSTSTTGFVDLGHSLGAGSGGGYADACGIELLQYGSTLRFDYANDGNQKTRNINDVFVADKWYNITVVHDATTDIKIYVNNVLKTTISSTSYIRPDNPPDDDPDGTRSYYYVGNGNQSRGNNWRICNVVFYNYRSPNILNYFNVAKPKQYPFYKFFSQYLKFNYRFDRINFKEDGTEGVLDSSSNGLHLTPVYSAGTGHSTEITNADFVEDAPNGILDLDPTAWTPNTLNFLDGHSQSIKLSCPMVYTNAAGWQQGKIQTAFGNDYSFSMWFKSNNSVSTSGTLFEEQHKSNVYSSKIWLDSESLKIRWQGLSSDTVTSSTDIDNEDWHFITVVCDRGTTSIAFEVFLDGSSVGTGSGTGNFYSSLGADVGDGFKSPTLINNYAGDSPFIGVLGPVLLHEHKLTNAEHTTMYNSGTIYPDYTTLASTPTSDLAMYLSPGNTYIAEHMLDEEWSKNFYFGSYRNKITDLVNFENQDGNSFLAHGYLTGSSPNMTDDTNEYEITAQDYTELGPVY
tara:strand:+ start:955 stop:2679 length:1725 start_codon:yes stop_codon:yes gene_type:complete